MAGNRGISVIVEVSNGDGDTAGAFDDLKHRRRALVAIHETAVDQYVDIKRNEAIGQDSLFGGLDDDAGGFGVSIAIPDIDEWDKQTLLGHERDMLGLYVSDHPLNGTDTIANSSAEAPLVSRKNRRIPPIWRCRRAFSGCPCSRTIVTGISSVSLTVGKDYGR